MLTNSGRGSALRVEQGWDPRLGSKVVFLKLGGGARYSLVPRCSVETCVGAYPIENTEQQTDDIGAHWLARGAAGQRAGLEGVRGAEALQDPQSGDTLESSTACVGDRGQGAGGSTLVWGRGGVHPFVGIWRPREASPDFILKG